jgi:hypothetical protein
VTIGVSVNCNKNCVEPAGVSSTALSPKCFCRPLHRIKWTQLQLHRVLTVLATVFCHVMGRASCVKRQGFCDLQWRCTVRILVGTTYTRDVSYGRLRRCIEYFYNDIKGATKTLNELTLVQIENTFESRPIDVGLCTDTQLTPHRL